MRSAAAAVCVALAGLVGLALLWSGTPVYRDLVASEPSRVPLAVRAAEHTVWLRYVTGRGDVQPDGSGLLRYTPSERAHMADVRVTFIAAQLLVVPALAGLAALLAVARDRRRLVRNAAAAAAAGVAVAGILAAVAFDAVFLLFHEVFFPQGNFLFGPDSDLLLVYPEPYWYGVTLRIGATFVVLAVTIAVLAHVSGRRRPYHPAR